MALLFDSVRRAVDPRTAPDVPMTLQWEFPDAEPWHLRLDNGSTAAVPGRAPAPDVELRLAFDDWVDLIAGRLDPKKAVATRRLRLKGSPRALWRARGVFGYRFDRQRHAHVAVLRAVQDVLAGLGEPPCPRTRRLEW